MERDYRKDYEELISKLKTILLDSQTNETISIDSIRKVIPELFESKDNIENRLINAIKSSAQLENCLQKHGFKIEEVIACLEKQAKQDYIDAYEDWYKFVRWFVKERTDDYTLIPSDDDIHYWGNIILNHARKLLKKQGENHIGNNNEMVKPSNEVGPKFKVGDFILNGDITNKGEYEVFKILKVCSRWYYVENIYDGSRTMITFAQEYTCRLWAIEDAKDGDVLAYPDGTIVLFKYRLDGLNSGIYMSHVLLATKIETCQSCAISKDLHPATKEQRDLLFQKMKEARYEWDAEKKELKKMKIKQSQEWNEEDEKQNEQKTTEEIVPKFKVGDWIVQGNSLCQIEKVINLPGNHFQYWTTDEHWFGDETEAHLWTIQDAKNGNILTYHLDDGKVLIIIYECLGESFDGEVDCHALLDLDEDYFSASAGAVCCKSMELLTPSTKEQHDLLFQKMHEKGYEWDAEKKELKKIKQICYRYHNDGLYCAIDILAKTLGKVEGYQSDDGIIEHQTAIETVSALYHHHHKKPAEWSEGDEEKLNSIIEVLGDNSLLVQWLKSFKDRVQPQPKQEWSEEDENRFNNLIHLIGNSNEGKGTKEGFIKFINRIKSLKPQNRWKPNEEQMEIINMILTNESMDDNVARVLRELKEQLEKL